MKCKVFGVGLSRTGTSSLAHAMSFLGYRARHAPRYIDEVGEFDFLNDIAIAWRYRFLDLTFPDAKFILTVRNVESWIDSCDRHYRRSKRNSEPLRRKENRFMCYGAIHFDPVAFKRAYHRHVAGVLAHFKRCSKRLLIINICSGEGWEKLCPFLGVPLPAVSFPHCNVGDAS